MTELMNWRCLTEEVNSGVLFSEVCDRIYDSFRVLLPYDRMGVAMVDPDRDKVTAGWAKTTAETVLLGVGYSAPLKGSSLQKILETGRPRIINDLPAYLLRKPESESTRLIVEEGVQSSLTCPLTIGGRHIGFVFFSSLQLNAYRTYRFVPNGRVAAVTDRRKEQNVRRSR